MKNIFHLRLQQIELQAERMIDHTLRTKPIAIISSHHDNGSIVALSNEAKNEGLFKGMKIRLARKMSHSVRMLPYNHRLYSHIHKNISKTICNYTPLFEPGTYGQYYMDMSGTSGIHGEMNDVGRKIIHNIYKQINMKSKKIINPGKTAIIPTGLAVAIPKNYEIQIRPRSGLAAKKSVSVLNTPGTIDADYRGEIKIILINLSKKSFVIKSGDRIAQMVLCPVVKCRFKEVKKLPKTIRGKGGFGSTGK